MSRGVKVITGAIAVVLAIALLVFCYCIVNEQMTLRTISGKSMLPTLYDGDFIATWKCDEYDYDDIVTFRNGDDTYIKRVFGKSGDVIQISDGYVYRNGTRLVDDYVKFGYTKYGDNMDVQVMVPSGSYYVLGDNRVVSDDSRYNDVGCVSSSQIVGKMVYKFPFKSPFR